jgi:hypothetical protein
MTFGHNSFVWTPISTTQLLGAETFRAEQVTNPCFADYLIEPLSAGRFKGYGRRSPNDDGTHPGYYSMGFFGSAESIHTYAQTAGKGIKWAYKEAWDALDSANCPTTSGRSAPSWPYDNDAVIIVGYKNGTEWGYFRPKSASSRGLAGSWFNGTEAQAIAQSQATSNYVILNAGVCGKGSFAVNLTPEEILGRVQECATPSNCAVSAWSAWSSCNNGSQTRTRTITNPSTNGGTACPELTQTQTCTETNGGGGGGGVTECNYPNRKKNSDGSCSDECEDGYEFNQTQTCVEIDPNDCATTNQIVKDDKTCGDCASGYSQDADGKCVETQADPNDCGSENRKVKDDKTCGDCASGYSEDEDGECVEDKANWLLWGGGLAAIALLATQL